MSALERFASAIEYPQAVPAEAVSFAFMVDGGEIRCLDLGKRLVFMRELTRQEDELMRLARYCVGRILREEASLFWDGEAAILSQEIPTTASAYEMRTSFEAFLDSCDWYLARMEPVGINSSSFPEMVIRP